MSKYILGSGSQIDKDYESALLLKKRYYCRSSKCY